jgi:general secretion pathway protein D
MDNLKFKKPVLIMNKLGFISAVISLVMLSIGASAGVALSPPAKPVPVIQQHPPLGTPPSPQAPAPSTPAKPGGPRLWNLQDVALLDVINEVSRETGKNFLIAPGVNGKVSIVSSHPIDANELYQVFLATLQIHGYAAVPSGNMIKIVPDANAKQMTTAIANDRNPGIGDEVVVRVLPVTNLAAAQLVPMLRPLVPEWGDVSVYAPNNTLIISGTAANIGRIVELVSRIDNSNSTGVELVALRNATAADLVSEISSLEKSSAASGLAPQVSLAADNRSNSILVSGNESARLRMRDLITQLDKPSKSATNTTQVVYLRYLKAKDLVAVLGGDKNSLSSETDTDDYALSDHAKDALSASPAYNSALRTGPAQNGGFGSDAKSATSTPSVQNKRVRIIAEPNTNAVIITAPPADMQNIKAVIAKLDKRPAEVLVEAVMVEVNENRIHELGIKWGRPTGADGVAPSDDDGFAAITGGLGVGIINHTDLKLLIRALNKDESTNILSTPSLMVLNNHQAKFEIGQKVPVTTGAYANTTTTSTGTSSSAAGVVNPFTTTTMTDVNLYLKVRPQISEGNAVRLLIDQGNSTLSGSTGAAGNPIINNSRIKTSVLINSGQILVLGGLISKDIEESTRKVPILGDIPILGRVFQNKNPSSVTKNFMVFLRPVIVHGTEDAACPTEAKYNFMREKELEQRDKTQWDDPFRDKPVLPLQNQASKLPDPFSNLRDHD